MSMGGMKTPIPQMGGVIPPDTHMDLLKSSIVTSSFTTQMDVTLDSNFDWSKYSHAVVLMSAKGYLGVALNLRMRFNGDATGYYWQKTSNANGVLSGSEGNNSDVFLLGDTPAGSGLFLILRIFKNNVSGLLNFYSIVLSEIQAFHQLQGFENAQTVLSSIDITDASSGGFITNSKMEIFGVKR